MNYTTTNGTILKHNTKSNKSTIQWLKNNSYQFTLNGNISIVGNDSIEFSLKSFNHGTKQTTYKDSLVKVVKGSVRANTNIGIMRAYTIASIKYNIPVRTIAGWFINHNTKNSYYSSL